MILKVTIPETCRRLGKANTIKGVGGPDGKVTITISGKLQFFSKRNLFSFGDSRKSQPATGPCFSIPSFFYGLKSMCFLTLSTCVLCSETWSQMRTSSRTLFQRISKAKKQRRPKKCDGGWKKTHWHLRWHLKWSSEFSLVNPMYFSLVRSIPKYIQMYGIVFLISRGNVTKQYAP